MSDPKSNVKQPDLKKPDDKKPADQKPADKKADANGPADNGAAAGPSVQRLLTDLLRTIAIDESDVSRSIYIR